MQKTITIILSYIILELSLLITFHKGCFLCHVLAYKWCYKICLLLTIGIWGAFLASSDVLVPNIMVVKGSLFSCTVVVIVVIIKFGRLG